MTKNFWFKHDAHARNDVKIRKLTRKYGMEGYGCYFVIIEILSNEPDNKLLLDEDGLELLCEEMRHTNILWTKELIDFIVKINLLKLSNNQLFSVRMVEEKKKQKSYRKKQSEGGKKAMAKRWGKTTESVPDPVNTSLEVEPETLKALVPAGEQVPLTTTQQMTAFQKREKKMELVSEYHDLINAIKNIEQSPDKPHYWKDMWPCTQWIFDFAKLRMKKVIDFESENILEQQAIIEFLKMIYVGEFLPWSYEDNIVENGLARANGNKDFAIKNFYNNFITFMKAEHDGADPRHLSPAVRYVILHTKKI
jgi:hypothetical protein